MTTSGHTCSPTNASDVLNTDRSNGTIRCDSTGSTSVTTLGAAECASRTVCALSHVLPSDNTDSLSINRRGLQAPSVRLDVTSLLHLLLSCLRHFASVDPGHLDELTTWVTQYTKVLDLPSDFESNITVSSQQLLASVQSSYDLSRRLCMVTQRLTSSLSVWAMFWTLRLQITMQTLVQHVSESTDCTLHDSLRSAVQLMVIHLAELTRVRSVVDILQTLVDNLSHYLAQRFPSFNNDVLTSACDGHPRRSETSTSPDRSDTRSPVRLDFPNWIRTAKLIYSLKHVNRSLVTLLNEIWESESQVHRQFSLLCNKLIDRIFDQSSTNGTHQLISTDQIDRFLENLQCDTICTNLQELDATTTTESVFTTLCQFHQSVYSSIFKLPFDQFCVHWLNKLEEQKKQLRDRDSITALLRHHTSNVQHLGCALLTRQLSMPVQLLTLFCGCDSFRKLQTSTLGPYEVFEQQQQSAHCEEVMQLCEFTPGTQTTDDSSGTGSTVLRTSPTVTNPTHSSLCCMNLDSAASATRLTVRHRLTDRLNAPGEALAAFAAGVRTSFLLPFKPSDGSELPVPSHTSRLSTKWSVLHLPTRSRSASRSKREKNEPS
ncbi:hypothetical protein P879_01721 [Paragonimus westermani]|uniref:Uncharacterized protein n=1 Tax=Paragonimus westermani TaxID=34504 RepID=A0A8T0DR44_9TREM|nr:hypothetical protein P879_01721 [Paragonimus westermani]